MILDDAHSCNDVTVDDDDDDDAADDDDDIADDYAIDADDYDGTVLSTISYLRSKRLLLLIIT